MKGSAAQSRLIAATGALPVKPETSVSAAWSDPLSAVLSVVAFGGVVYGLGSLGETVNGAQTIPPAIPLTIDVVVRAAFNYRLFAFLVPIRKGSLR